MAETFRNFLDQIPPVIRAETEVHFDPNIIVFRPASFIIGSETYLEDYHFILPTSDPPPLKIEGQEHWLKKGKLIPLAPETRLLCTKPAPTGKYIALNIKKDFLERITREVVDTTDVTFPRIYNPYTIQLINLICSFEEELENYKYSSPLMLESISTQIVIQILREAGISPRVKEKESSADNKYVNMAKDYIKAFYSANIKIADICEEIHLSPYYFMRIFKDQTGQSPHEFLLSFRMSKAEEFLRRGNYSIEEVARLCGFVNSAHFSNHFKRVKGMPPSEYRRKVILM